MIRHPDNKDLPQLISLWEEAFGDSFEETQAWFKARNKDDNMLVYEEDGLISGMMSMLPVDLMSQQKAYPARYVFAVATRKSHRGRGISSRLLDKAHDLMRKEGSVASLLVPAEDSLFDFYGKRGYQTQFFIDEALVDGKDLQAVTAGDSAAQTSAAEYLSVRNEAFRDSGLFIRWDVEALDFIRQSGLSNGDQMLTMRIGGRTAAAVCMVREGYVRVTELICQTGDVPRALALIHQRYQARHYQVRMREGSLGMGSSRPFGMIHWLGEPLAVNGSPPYLSFAKD